MRNAYKYLGFPLTVLEILLASLTGYLIRSLIIDKLSLELELAPLHVSSKWIILPLVLVILLVLLWRLDRILRAWLAKQTWWSEDGSSKDSE